jgi:predicted homoserine dehydrogenase-like protein
MADKAGVVYTLSDGDQPGVEMNLYRYVLGMGLKPVLCGNIKGLHDPYRTPETQKAFADKWHQTPAMVTSFADGSKISYEQACVANATGMSVAKRGMHGYVLEPNSPIETVVNQFNVEELSAGSGLVDYVVGAEPNGGIFVLATTEDKLDRHFLDLYKVGKGPLYCFYTPYHLCHFHTRSSIARAVLFNDPVIAPKDKVMVEVIAAAKRDLKAGETIDPIGHFMTYGLCENSTMARKENLLPLGLAENCTLRRDIPKDQVLTFDDVVVPQGRLIDQLWQQQFE